MDDFFSRSEPLRWTATVGDPDGSRFLAPLLLAGTYPMHVEARRVSVDDSGAMAAEVYPEDLEAVQSIDVESRFRVATAAELAISGPGVSPEDRFVVFAYPFGE